MNLYGKVLEGTIQPDGTLVLDRPTKLPAGRVQVTFLALTELPKNDPFWDMMNSIWADQKARGHHPRSSEEIEGERRKTREDWEERQKAIERLQEESRRLREEQAW